MKRTIVNIALILAAGFAMMNATGCGDDALCENDQNCVLSGDKTYNHTCDNSTGCNYACERGATCHLSCPSGNCSVSAPDATEVILDCAGNNCSVSCANTPTCKIENCTTGCSLGCGNADVCTNSCDVMGGCTTADANNGTDGDGDDWDSNI